jgi:hypothetical protein
VDWLAAHFDGHPFADVIDTVAGLAVGIEEGLRLRSRVDRRNKYSVHDLNLNSA